MTEKEWYHLRKKHHICTRCGKEDAYTLGGRSHCYECAQNRRENKARQYADPEKKKKLYANHRNYQQKRRQNGICPTCGRPATPGYSTCEYCRAKHRNYMRKYRNHATRGEYGTCWQCNKRQAIPGKRVCEECRVLLSKNIEKANDALKMMKDSGWKHPWKIGNAIIFKVGV